MTGQRVDLNAFILVVIVTGMWGLNQVAIKVANEDMTPVFQASLRSFGSLVPLVVWCKFRNISLFSSDGTSVPGLLIGLTFACNFLLLYVGLSYTTAGHAAIALYTMPLYLSMRAHFFLPGERLTLMRSVGLIAAFAGVVLIFTDIGSNPGGASLFGDLLCVLSAMS